MKACSVCNEPSVRRQGNQNLCAMHYRFGQMRATARRRNKAVPSRAELEQMVLKCRMHCGDCGVLMNWLAIESQTSVATLQHYRDGSMSLVCRSCNTRHAYSPDDSFRDAPRDHKYCPACRAYKPILSFARDGSRSGPMKLKSHCKDCSHDEHTRWRVANRTHYNAKQREYRARRVVPR